jgi:hypothetical protein
MLAKDIFSGHWLAVAGGATPNSCQVRFLRVEDYDWQLDLMYKFDVDEVVSLRFVLTPDEVERITSELQEHGYARLTSVKNSFPFVLEMQLDDGNPKMKLDGHGMTWPGHPQRFLMTEFAGIE